VRKRHPAQTIALPLAFAALGVAPALAAGGGSGLSISPPVIEHSAVPGKVGSLKISNATGAALTIGVTTHPWVQAASGAVSPNQRGILGTVRPSVTSFVLANNASRTVSISLLEPPRGGSIYGNIDVTGIPAQGHGPDVVTIGYRLVASLRLDPVHAVRVATAGAAKVTGDARHGTVVLAVHNSGNTIEPIGGSVHISGGRGAENGSVGSVRILPGKTVDVPVFTLDGSLPAGSYSLEASLSEGGHHVLSAKRTFKLA
jgi:hypothetical protein